MHRAFLGLAAIAGFAAYCPASAQGLAASGGLSAMSAGESFRAGAPGLTMRPSHDGVRRGHSRHIRVGASDGYFESGYNDYGDYDANRSFDPDKWNDWWHERPQRAFPRWVWSNQNCTADRMWYSGSGWRCTP